MLRKRSKDFAALDKSIDEVGRRFPAKRAYGKEVVLSAVNSNADFYSFLIICNGDAPTVAVWTILKESTCYSIGVKMGSCVKCGKGIHRTFSFSSAHDHLTGYCLPKKKRRICGAFEAGKGNEPAGS